MNTAVTHKPLRTLLEEPAYKKRIGELLKDRAPQFAAALVQIVGRSSYLQKCDPNSVIGAAITAAALDLSFDPNLGEAHLVPYKDQCQFQLGYRGLTQLGLRSGQYKRLGWKIVYAGELVKWDELTGDLILDSERKTSDDVVGYAAYFALVNGFERASYWSKAKVEKHAERYSQAYKSKQTSSPWYTTFDVMALKTVLKELLSHWGPKSIQLQTAILKDQQVFSDIDHASYADNQDAQRRKVEVKTPLFGHPADSNVVDVEPVDDDQIPDAEVPAQPRRGRPRKESPAQASETVGVTKEDKGNSSELATPESEPPPRVINYASGLRKLLAIEKITEGEWLNYLNQTAKVTGLPTSLEDLVLSHPDVAKAAFEEWQQYLGEFQTWVESQEEA